MNVYRFGNRPQKKWERIFLIGFFLYMGAFALWSTIASWRASVGLGIFLLIFWVVMLTLFAATMFNARKGYIEIRDDTVHIVYYRFFIRREAFVSLGDVAYATIRYYRAVGYILFKNQKKKTLFYVHATPQTKEFFAEYLDRGEKE